MSEEKVLELTPDQALKDLVGSVVDLCNFLVNVSQGFSFKEIGEAIDLASDLRTTLNELPLIQSQYQGLDDQARQDLYGYIADNVTLPQAASVQAVVEKVLEVAVALSTAYQLIVPAPAAK